MKNGTSNKRQEHPITKMIILALIRTPDPNGKLPIFGQRVGIPKPNTALKIR